MSKLIDTLRTLLTPITHSIDKKPDRSEIPGMIPHIPTKLAEMKDDSNHRTVTEEQMSYWDAKSGFSGDYDDLYNAPSIASVALSGDYNDLDNLPAQKIVTYSSRLKYDPDHSGSEYNLFQYIDKSISISFHEAPNKGGGAFFISDYVYPKGRGQVPGYATNYVYWGNGSLHSSDLEDSGEEWCVYVTRNNSGYETYHCYHTSDDIICNLGIVVRTIEYVPLEDALIPSTIARTEDLSEVATSGSYPDLTDKPFETITKNINIEWDGTAPEGVDSFTIGTSDIYYYKFSDEVPDPELITSAYAEVSNGKTGGDILYGTNCYQITPSSVAAVLVVTEAGAGTRPKGDSFTAPSTGVYLYWVSDKYTTKCQIEYEVVEQLDEKYIPDTIARVEDIPEGFSGSWNDLSDKPFYSSIKIADDATPVFGPYEATQSSDTSMSFRASKYADVELVTVIGDTVAPLAYSVEGSYTKTHALTNEYVQFMEVVNTAGTTAHKQLTVYNFTEPFVVTVYNASDLSSETRQLEEKFIPDTIARTGDIPDAVLKVNGTAPDDAGNVEVSEMPAADGAFKQLVTDADGNTKWEERVGYKDWDYVEESDIPVGIYSQGYGSLPFELFPVEGEEYTVTWDGTQYSCPATIITIDDENVTIIGSTTFCGGTVAPDIPVGVCCRSGKATVYSSQSGEHTIGISGYVMYPVKIPREYIDWNPVVGVIDSSWYNYRYLNEARGASIAEIRKAAREKNKDIIIRLDLDNWQGTIRYLGLIDVSEDGETYFPALVFSTIKTNNASINVADETINGTMDLEYWYTPLEPAEGPPANAFVNLQFGKINLAQLSEEIGASVPVIQTATVGQTVVVKAVDENGKPTEWEAADMGGGDVSWNDLQDRPFGDVVESTTLVENYTAEFEARTNVSVPLTATSSSSSDKPLRVVWDGVVYDNVGISYGGSVFMDYIAGSSSIWNAPDGEHEYPFLIVGFGYDQTTIMAATEGEHTFSIYQVTTATTQIDEKFIPYTIMRSDIDVGRFKEVYFSSYSDNESGYAANCRYKDIHEGFMQSDVYFGSYGDSVTSTRRMYSVHSWNRNSNTLPMKFMATYVEEGALVMDCFTVNSDDTVTRDVQKFTLTPVTETTE